jgi:ribonucleoside-triphosphate reductase
MGCRTETMANINGEDGPEGRGNIAPVSMNLPRIGIEAKGNWDKFYKNLDKLMDLCADNLMHRKGVLAKLRVKDLPFVAGQGLMKGSEELSPDDSIEPILRQGTWSIGFIGLAETMVAMTGHHHGEGGEYWDKAYEIVKHMREKTDEYRQK